MKNQELDCITIQDLEVFGHHGVLKEENVLGQKFLVTIKMFTDTSESGQTDSLEKSIDYATVSHKVQDFMKNHTFQLIETVAEKLARELLLDFSLIQEIEITVKKPWAPVLLPLDTVAVSIKRKRHLAYLSVGSNMGDCEGNLNQAVKELEKCKEISNVKASKWIKTKPYGYLEQDDFLNGAVAIETVYSPFELLDFLHQIEKNGKRERTIHWGPRTIDLDIVLFDDMIVETEELTIPHKEMHLREFVLKPLSELAPWAIHPVFKKTVTEMLSELSV